MLPKFSPDGERLAFLKNVQGSYTLYEANLENGNLVELINSELTEDKESTFSLEEKLRRERLRQLGEGIMSYDWVDNYKIVFPQQGSLFTVDLPLTGREGIDHEDVSSDGMRELLVPSAPKLLYEKNQKGCSGDVIDAKVSPKGNMIAFVQDGELYLIPDLEKRSTFRITSGAVHGSISNGLVDFINAEEFDRMTGFWWSPDGNYIAFQHTDESHIPIFRIPHLASEDPHAYEDHRYPFAGKENARVKIGVIDVLSVLDSISLLEGESELLEVPEPVWMDTGITNDFYLVRVDWLTSPVCTLGSRLILQLLDRSQKCLDVVVYDIASGQGTLLLRDLTPCSSWINVLNASLHIIPSDSAFIRSCLPPNLDSGPHALFLWLSERSGFCAIEAFAIPDLPDSDFLMLPHYAGIQTFGSTQIVPDDDGSISYSFGSNGGFAIPVRRIAGGSTGSIVESISCISHPPDNLSGSPVVFFSGTFEGPLERHFYCTSLKYTAGLSDVKTTATCKRLTSGAGMHNVVMSPFSPFFVDTLSTLHCAPSMSLYTIGVDAYKSMFSSRWDATKSVADSASTVNTPLRSDSSLNNINNVADIKNLFEDPGFYLLNSIISFEKSDQYGSRIAESVSHMVVMNGSLPLSPGPPPLYAAHNQHLHQSIGLLMNKQEGESEAITKVSYMIDQVAAALSKGITRVSAAASSRHHKEPKVQEEISSQELIEASKKEVRKSSNFRKAFASLSTTAGQLLTSIGSTVAPDSSPIPVTPQNDASSFDSAGTDTTESRLLESEAVTTRIKLMENSSEQGIHFADAGLHPKDSTISGEFSQRTGGPNSQPPSTLTPSTRAPLIVSIPAADGKCLLYCALFLPDPVKFGLGPYPTLVSVYGGPCVQRVKHCWTLANENRARTLCNSGYLVVCVDNRGTARRGIAFESKLYRNMGTVEVEDQVHVVKFLTAVGIVDKNRVGIYGWSYGGYMTLLCLAKAPDVFRLGVAGAPVTEFEGYDTGYTERYMSTPQDNPEGYKQASVLTHVSKNVPRVLLVHGQIDENVHFRHSMRLVQKFVEENVYYETFFLPNERHFPRWVTIITE